MKYSFFLLLIILVIASCSKDNRWDCLKRTGDISFKTENLQAFSILTLEDQFQVEIILDTIDKIIIEGGKNLLINTATGDRMTTCAATSAAFVNGIKAFSVEKGMVMLLPVLKFSYYRILTDKKMEILTTLSKPNCCISLEELSKKTKMSLPLISYHINGNLKSEGLKKMGLVETDEIKGRMEIKLSVLGRMLIHGYVN